MLPVVAYELRLVTHQVDRSSDVESVGLVVFMGLSCTVKLPPNSSYIQKMLIMVTGHNSPSLALSSLAITDFCILSEVGSRTGVKYKDKI